MSDSQSINTSLLDVMISSKDEVVFIRNLCDLTFQIIAEAWGAWMNIDSKHPITWSNSRHASLWRLNLHCGIEETASPCIIFTVCHHVQPHPSHHGTSSMGKHLLAKVHIAELNKSQSQKFLNWQVQPLLKRLGPYWRDRSVVELQ